MHSTVGQAPLGVCSTKCRHQSPELTILSHVNCFIQFNSVCVVWLSDAVVSPLTEYKWRCLSCYLLVLWSWRESLSSLVLKLHLLCCHIPLLSHIGWHQCHWRWQCRVIDNHDSLFVNIFCYVLCWILRGKYQQLFLEILFRHFAVDAYGFHASATRT